MIDDLLSIVLAFLLAAYVWRTALQEVREYELEHADESDQLAVQKATTKALFIGAALAMITACGFLLLFLS